MDERTPLVSTEWLARQRGRRVSVVDGSWYLPADRRDPKGEFEQGHIPGAVYFDLDANSRPSSLPHMMPTAEAFSASMSALGINDTDTIVVYDTAGLFSAARVRWMFKVFGATQAYVLDGGLPKWLREGRGIETGAATVARAGSFRARLDADAIADRDDVSAAVATAALPIIDARAAARFRGDVPEPRPGVRPGHIPASVNMPYSELIDPQGQLLAPPDLRRKLEGAGIDLARPAIASCGSGVTAAIVALAMERLGQNDVAIYDGSWAEWGADPALPVETGAPRR